MKDEIQRQASILARLIPDLAKAFGTEGLEEILDIEINFAQVDILFQIYILKEPIMSELSEATNTQLSTLTRAVDKLVQKGFVVRKTDPRDRRVVRVSLTSSGVEVVKKFKEARRKKIASILKKLTHHEREEVVQMLQTLHQRISNEASNED